MRRVINIAENASHSSHQDRIVNGVFCGSPAAKGTGIERCERQERLFKRANDDTGTNALGLSGFPIAALFLVTLHRTAGLLTDLLNEEWRLTRGTGLIDRAVPQGILTLWVTTARIKIAALFRTLLNEISPATRLGTFHT